MGNSDGAQSKAPAWFGRYRPSLCRDGDADAWGARIWIMPMVTVGFLRDWGATRSAAPAAGPSSSSAAKPLRFQRRLRMHRILADTPSDLADRLDRLAGELDAAGVLNDPAWRAAFHAVPRDLFIPDQAWI